MPLRNWNEPRVRHPLESRALLALGLVVVAVLYYPALGLGLFWDDTAFFWQNEAIHDGSSPHVFWTRGHEHTRAWPLLYTTFWVMRRLFGDRLALYHLASVLGHVAAGLMLYRSARRRNLRYPELPALLFWIHPVAVSPVFWLSQMGKCGTLLLLLAWLELKREPGTLGRAVGAVASLLGACLYSGQAALIFLAHAFLSPLRGVPKRARFWAKLLGVLVSSYVILLVLAGTAMSIKGIELRRAEPGAEFLFDRGYFAAAGYLAEKATPEELLRGSRAAGYSFLHAAARFALPLPETFPAPKVALGPVEGALCSLLAVLVLALTAWLLRKRSEWAWPILALIPSSGLLYFPYLMFSPVADRYLYVSLGLLLLPACEWLDPRIRRYTEWLLALFLLYLGYQAWRRSGYIFQLHYQMERLQYHDARP